MLKILTLIFISSFGFFPSCNSHAVPTHMAYSGGYKLQRNKERIGEVCRDFNCTTAELTMILAIGMLETEHIDAKERDKSTDYNVMMKNYSAFNLNGDLLHVLGYEPSFWEELNQPDGLHKAVRVILAATRNLGWGTFIEYYRGDSRAKIDSICPREMDYKTAAEELAHYLTFNSEYQTDSSRVTTRRVKGSF